MYISLLNSGIRVGRSEASRHDHGSEAYRDRARAREHHHVSFCFAISQRARRHLRIVVFQRVAKCHWIGRASEKAGAPYREELDRRSLVSDLFDERSKLMMIAHYNFGIIFQYRCLPVRDRPASECYGRHGNSAQVIKDISDSSSFSVPGTLLLIN